MYFITDLQPCFRNCTFGYFLEIVEIVAFWKKKYLKSSYIYVFYPKSSNYFHYSGMFSHRKLPDLSLNNISSVLSIGLQYTLSFKGADFGLKCRVTIIFFSRFELFAVSALFHDQVLFFCISSAGKINISFTILVVFQSRRFRETFIDFSNNIITFRFRIYEGERGWQPSGPQVI